MAKSVGRIEGVERADLSFPTATLLLEYRADVDPRAEVLSLLRASGHDAEPLDVPGVPTKVSRLGRHEVALAAGAALVAAGWGLSVADTFWSRPASIAAFAAATVVGGALTARRAWASVRARSLDMNVLMSIAVIGAAAIGQWEEAATVVLLFALGQYLESRALERTRRSIRDLVALAPAKARVRRDGAETMILPEVARVDDVMVVKPGERIALDGVVTSGASSVDESAITGESVSAEKSPGSKVFAGTLNTSGLLEARVTSVAADSTLAKVIHLVEEAQAGRAPLQRLVDRFTRRYTPTVVGLAALVALGPPTFTVMTGGGAEAYGEWFYRALVLLVVSCPCALVISTPVAIVSAIARAGRDGILVKGGVFLEAAERIRVVAFDKTGTLTVGRPEVSDVVPLDGGDAAEVLRVAARLESGSSHPIAEAVTRAEGEVAGAGRVSDFVESPGRGIRGAVDGQAYALGTPSMVEQECGLAASAQDEVARLEGEGKTVLVLSTCGEEARAIGLVAVADMVRPEARETVEALRSLGVDHVVMLTGDNERTAAAVAREAGITESLSRLLPDDKVDHVRRMTREVGPVLMVGDGVNDAPALALADIGVAMGAAGSDTALETADVALMSSDLRALPLFLDLGRRTGANVRSNVAFSVVTKLVVLAAALGGWATLWLAVFADMGVSLLVTANGLRLLRRSRLE